MRGLRGVIVMVRSTNSGNGDFMNKSRLLAMMVLAVQVSFVRADGDGFFCKDAYQTKLARIEKNRPMRKAGRVGLIVASSVGGFFMPLLLWDTTALVLGAFFFGPVSGVSASKVNDYWLDREPGLRTALNFFRQSAMSESEVKQELYNAYVDLRLIEINDNVRRRREGTFTREQVVEKIGPVDKLGLVSQVDMILRSVNDKRIKKSLSPLIYDEFRSVVLSDAGLDTFCPVIHQNGDGTEDRRPETMRVILKHYLKKLGK